MTFCKMLATAKRDEDTITAYELHDYGSAVPRYEITVSRDGIARLIQPTARTTWKKRFKEMANV